jgi:hypothetical protein
MKEPHDTKTKDLYFGNTRISIKVREDHSDVNPSGWSLMAFAPSASVRCVRGHQPKHLDLFIESVLVLADVDGDENNDAVYDLISNTIYKLTDGALEYGRQAR